MKIGKLLKSLEAPLSCGKDFEVGGISCNSKEVADNYVFVAVRGTNADGHNFIKEAINKGAKAVISEDAKPGWGWPENILFVQVVDSRKALGLLAADYYGHPARKMKVIGVTGTNGKTTVTYLIEAILKEARAPCGVIGTVNCRFKDEIIPSKNTTPGPLELQSMLAKMLAAGCKYAVTEVSSHALDQARTCGIDFQGAIFTNLTHDHLDYHKTKAQYFQCKTRLFSGLSRGALAVVNNDDAYGRKIRDLTSAEVVSYGINEKADFVARAIKLRPQRTTFKIVTAKAGIEISSPLIGRHNVYNILAAFSWAYKAGVPPPAIKAALENFSAVPGRLERIDSKRGFSVYVDYAHTQDALKNILTALREFSPQRIIVVFGCGGDRDRNKRPKMGRVVSELSDYTIVTSDNPRREDPLEIIGHISEGIRKNNYCIIPERRDAIKMSLALARKDDIVVVAGKGHEDYQILKDKVLHFDDRRVVRECLESMSL